MVNEEAERIRKLYKYRRMILNGEIVLPYREATLLIGPDCAYHLYSIPGSTDKGNQDSKNKEQRTKNNDWRPENKEQRLKSED